MNWTELFAMYSEDYPLHDDSYGMTDERFAKILCDFVDSGFERKKFTLALYHKLCQQFFHIAHYNIDGFYGTWFARLEQRIQWLDHILNCPHWCDTPAERLIMRIARESGLRDTLADQLTEKRRVQRLERYHELKQEFEPEGE